MNADETKRKRGRGGRRKLYRTEKEQRAALRARQARYNEKRAQSGKNVHAFLPPALFEKMAAAAAAAGISRNEYVKRLIAAAVEHQIDG